MQENQAISDKTKSSNSFRNSGTDLKTWNENNIFLVLFKIPLATLWVDHCSSCESIASLSPTPANNFSNLSSLPSRQCVIFQQNNNHNIIPSSVKISLHFLCNSLHKLRDLGINASHRNLTYELIHCQRILHNPKTEAFSMEIKGVFVWPWSRWTMFWSYRNTRTSWRPCVSLSVQIGIPKFTPHPPPPPKKICRLFQNTVSWTLP